MGLFSNFPYSDFENINLDWIIRKVKEYLDKVDKLDIDFNNLKEYVTSYFDNLDIQEEVNNKLDEMASSGQLAEIIAQYLDTLTLIAFNTKANMKSADNLVNGIDILTLGTDTYNDGKTVLYKVRELTTSDIIDDIHIVALSNYPSLIAENVKEIGGESLWPRCPYFKPEDYGAVVDDETVDNAPYIKQAIDDAIANNGIVLLSYGVYHTQSMIEITEHPYGLQILGVGATGRNAGSIEVKGTELYYHGSATALLFSNGIHSSLLKDFTIRVDNDSATCLGMTHDTDPDHIARTTMTRLEDVRLVYTAVGLYTTNIAYLRLIRCDFAALRRVANQKAIAVVNTYTNNEYLYLDNVVIDGYEPAVYGNALSTSGIYFERMTHVEMNNVDITDCDYAIYLNANYEISFININTIDIARCRYGIYGIINNNVINNFHCDQLIYTAPNDVGADDRVILMDKTAGGAAYAARMIIDNIYLRSGISEMTYWVEGLGSNPFGAGVTKINFRNNQNPKVNYGTNILQIDSDLSTTAQLSTSSVDFNDIKYSGLYPQTLGVNCPNGPAFQCMLLCFANHQKVIQIAISLDNNHTMARRIYTLSSDTWSAWSTEF